MKRGRRTNKYQSKYADTAALRATVISELQRLATNGLAPLQNDYNAQRQAGPEVARILLHLGCAWADLVAEAGLTQIRNPRQQNRRPRSTPETGDWPENGLAADINRYERAHWNDRYSTALAVIQQPTRVETLIGRTLAGEQCLITREYRMVR